MGDLDHMTITWGPRSHDNHMEDLDHMIITRGGVGWEDLDHMTITWRT